MSIRFVVSNCFFLVIVSLHAQENAFDRFLKHLYKTQQYQTGLSAINQGKWLDSSYYTSTQKEFYGGKFAYQLKKIEESIAFFDKISRQDKNYREAFHLKNFQYTYLGRINEAKTEYQTFYEDFPTDSSLIRFQLLGIAAMEENWKTWDSLNHYFHEQPYFLKQGYDLLTNEVKMYKDHNEKKPWVGALLSTLLPGSGKIYSGKTGEGIMAMLVTGMFALQAWEGYSNQGIASERFWIFGSAAAFTYVGNIYGSALAVKIQNQARNDQYNEAIQVTLHLPLRILFD